tara:strand:- start:3258 stop:3983 length:726 start_codon:yes stop_codon:yes gene_type:complete
MTIHDSVIIEEGALIPKNITIEPFSIIRNNVEIGDNSFIGSNCDIGYGSKKKLKIGSDSLIRSHSVIYGDSSFSNKFETGHHVTVRSGVNAGINFRLGTLGDLQGDIIIGDYVRMHSNVNLAKGTIIGNFVWISKFVNTTNDPHPPSSIELNVRINDYVFIAANSLILPGVEIGAKCLIGASSKVSTSTEEGYLYAGNPAKRICHTSKIRMKDGSNKSAYPWTNHYHIGYPKEIINSWVSL